MLILRYKDFARKDYEGLDLIGQEKLRNRRRELAQQLKDSYRSAQMAAENPQSPHGVGTKWKLDVGGHTRVGRSTKMSTESPLTKEELKDWLNKTATEQQKQSQEINQSLREDLKRHYGVNDPRQEGPYSRKRGGSGRSTSGTGTSGRTSNSGGGSGTGTSGRTSSSGGGSRRGPSGGGGSGAPKWEPPKWEPPKPKSPSIPKKNRTGKAIGAAIVGAGMLGLAAYKHYQHKKEEEEAQRRRRKRKKR